MLLTSQTVTHMTLILKIQAKLKFKLKHQLNSLLVSPLHTRAVSGDVSLGNTRSACSEGNQLVDVRLYSILRISALLRRSPEVIFLRGWKGLVSGVLQLVAGPGDARIHLAWLHGLCLWHPCLTICNLWFCLAVWRGSDLLDDSFHPLPLPRH